MKIVLSIKWLAIAVAVLFSLPTLAADYTVEQVERTGVCYDGNDRKISDARFCRACLTEGGDSVSWRFVVYCDGKKTAKQVKASLVCGRGEELAQLQILYREAEKKMNQRLSPFDNIPFVSEEFRDCDMDGWK